MATDKTIDLEKVVEKPQTEIEAWNPTDAQKERVKYVMEEYRIMDNLRRQTWRQFNDRTLQQFIDDSEKRLNAYVRSREEQGKEPWEANYATRIYANKAKALLASVARQIPDMAFNAVDTEDHFDHRAADLAYNLVRHSNNQGNPAEDMFFLAWSCVGRGTVIDYEGYERQNYVKKRIKSFDLLTGDVEEEETERVSNGEPVSFEIPLMDLLIKNWYEKDIQKQPSLIWESFVLTKEEIAATWGQYPNFKYVKDAADMTKAEKDTFFHSMWKQSLGNEGKGFIVMRYMNKYLDRYRVIINGVEIANSPLPWVDITRENFGKKAYPFAKTIYEPFADGRFFYGNSLVNSSMGEGDVLNTLWNSAMNKTFRSLVPAWLVGGANKDALDLEDEIVTGDTKINVEDINQIKQIEMRGVTDSELRMIDLVSSGIDLTTVDPSQSGQAQKYVTARSSVMADERARQLKGLFFMFMESLWLQKTRLRVPNVFMAYGQPRIKRIMGEEYPGGGKDEKKNPTFNVKNAKLSDGSRGTLAIELRDKDEIKENAPQIMKEVDAEETENMSRGKRYEKVVIPYGYLDELSYDIEIIPESLHEQNRSLQMALAMEKVEIISRVFPEYFADNKEKFFRDILKAYRDDPASYNIKKALTFEEQQQLEIAKRQSNRNGGGDSVPGAGLEDLLGGG